LCRQEAAALAALSPALKAAGVTLAAVLHEPASAWSVAEFSRYFPGGEVYLDPSRAFFGPQESRLGLVKGLLRYSTWAGVYAARQAGAAGDGKGDGTLLGGVYVIGPGETGILYEHRETSWGHHFDEAKLLQALDEVRNAKSRGRIA